MTQLTHFGWDYKVDSFEDIMEILKSHYFTVDTIMEEIHQPCSNLLIYCQYDRKEKKCNEMFQLIKTLEGYCCAFNYAALNDGFEDPFFDAEDDMEFYDDRKVGAIISTSKSGSYSGLTVVFDVHVEDYPPWSDFTFEGARILISDPNDFPETTVLTRYINPGDSMDVVVEPIVVTSDPVLRRIPVEQRNCWFHDEVDLAHTDRYSLRAKQTGPDVMELRDMSDGVSDASVHRRVWVRALQVSYRYDKCSSNP
ncbi:hypothetical protein JYU34_017035 [Plutella xylostella]|uniref:Uncharacterized protein n=1 Tax=Plutella xylostella TaxID=51655 RepID=A0ABQ7Q453_PLUXY|nr:hypothetical protein JYU34_017035 [Plutella xylostella]